MKYAYIRVSTEKQNIDRQYALLSQYVDNNHIYIDKESGKDFNRKNYQKLKKILKNGDEFYIKPIDRLDRNYNLITDEFRYLSKTIGVVIYVLDMPFINTFNEVIVNDTLRNFVIDLVLQILSFIAENERNNIKERQLEGIKIAKLKGKHLGRPKLIIPTNFSSIINKINNKELKLNEALKILKISKTTYYKYKIIYN